MELDERLATGVRGHHRAADLLAAATSGGARSLGWADAGHLGVGALADLDRRRPRQRPPGRRRARPPRRGGRVRRRGARRAPRDGRRPLDRRATASTCRSRSRPPLAEAIDAVWSGRVTTLVVDRIGLLVTNDPSLGDGPLGLVRDAAVVIEDGRVVAVTAAGAAADERVDAGGPLRRARLRGQPHPPGVRGRPGRGVHRPHGRPALRRRRDRHHDRGDPRRQRRRPPDGRGAAAGRGPGRRHHPRGDQVRLRARRRGRGPALPPGRRADRRRDLPRRPPRPGRVRRPGRRVRRARRRAHARRLRAVVPLGRRLLRGRRLRRRPDPRRPRGGRGPRAGAAGPRQPARPRSRACSWPSSWARRRPTTAPT